MSKIILNLLFIFGMFFALGCGQKEEDEVTKSEYKPVVVTDNTVNTTKLFWLYWYWDQIPEDQIKTEAPRRDIVILNANFHTYISKFKAINPDIKVMVYKDLSSSRSYAVTDDGQDSEYLPTGVGYVYATKNHPEWFLIDDNGNHLEYTGYKEHWQMDVGNPEYQNYWSDQVVEELERNGWDGVMLDNALFNADSYHAGVYSQKYKTDQSIQEAYKSMLTVVKSKFETKGKIGIANLAGARTHPGLWEGYMEHLHGGLDEWWLVFEKGSYLSDYSEGFKVQIDEVAYAEANGKITLVQPHSSLDDEQGFNYAFAGYWLVNNGNTYFSEQEVKDDYKDPSPWREEYEWNLGKPEGDYYEVSPHVYRRDFTRATVLVNSSSKGGSVGISLDETHLDKLERKTNGVSLKPLSGVVLRKWIVEE